MGGYASYSGRMAIVRPCTSNLERGRGDVHLTIIIWRDCYVPGLYSGDPILRLVLCEDPAHTGDEGLQSRQVWVAGHLELDRLRAAAGMTDRHGRWDVLRAGREQGAPPGLHILDRRGAPAEAGT